MDDMIFLVIAEETSVIDIPDLRIVMGKEAESLITEEHPVKEDNVIGLECQEHYHESYKELQKSIIIDDPVPGS